MSEKNELLGPCDIMLFDALFLLERALWVSVPAEPLRKTIDEYRRVMNQTAEKLRKAYVELGVYALYLDQYDPPE